MPSEENQQTTDKQVRASDQSPPSSMTVVFSDIKSYTQMSKSLHSSKLKELLDTYLYEMTQIIERYGGIIDKVMGDGILALFNNTFLPAEHAKNAVEAAIDMQTASAILRQEWQQLSGSVDLQVRTGIASGEVVLSDSKASSHKRGTAIGNVVNLASRLQEKAIPGSILVSQSTYLHIAQEFPCRHVADLELKGYADAYSAYEVLGKIADVGNKLSALGGGLHVSDEQRISPRQPLCIDIEYTVNGNYFVHRSINVSEGGLFISASKVQPIGTSLVIHASVPTDRGVLPIIINGQVARISKEGNDTGMGIQFSSIEAGQLETISYFINSVYGLADLSRTRVTENGQMVKVDILSPTELLKLNDALIPISCHELGCGAATYLTSRLLHEFRRTKRYNHEFSCIAIRVNKLRDISANNSKIDALKLVSKQISLSIRNTDEIFYLNEGVFVVLAPETMANRVKTLAGRIIREIHGFFQIQAPEFANLQIRAGTFSFDGRNSKDHNQILTNALDSCH